jgi:hypothetical protein
MGGLHHQYVRMKGQDAKMIKLAEIATLFRAAVVSPLIAEKRRTEIGSSLQVIDKISNLSGLDRRLELCIKQAKAGALRLQGNEPFH